MGGAAGGAAAACHCADDLYKPARASDGPAREQIVWFLSLADVLRMRSGCDSHCELERLCAYVLDRDDVPPD